MIKTVKQATAYLKTYHRDLKNNLQALLKDEAALNKIAQNSFIHDNHFAKLILKDDKDNGIKLRLHIWDKPFYHNQKSNKHNHRWSFVSIPLLGTFKELRFKELEENITSEEIYSVYKYEYQRTQSSQEIKSVSKVTLIKNEEYIRQAGELYSCESSAIHHYEPIEYPAASLVLTFDTIEKHSFLYTSSPITSNEHDSKEALPSLSIKDLKDLLLSLLEKI